MTTVNVNAARKDQLRAFALQLRALPTTSHPAIAAAVMANGLMLPKGFTAKWVHMCARFMTWRRGDTSLYTSYGLLFANKKFWPVATETFNQTVDWMVNGKDTTSLDSAGGYSQSELDQIIYMYQNVIGHINKQAA